MAEKAIPWRGARLNARDRLIRRGDQLSLRRRGRFYAGHGTNAIVGSVICFPPRVTEWASSRLEIRRILAVEGGPARTHPMNRSDRGPLSGGPGERAVGDRLRSRPRSGFADLEAGGSFRRSGSPSPRARRSRPLLRGGGKPAIRSRNRTQCPTAFSRARVVARSDPPQLAERMETYGFGTDGGRPLGKTVRSHRGRRAS